jgi:hypothetical protein
MILLSLAITLAPMDSNEYWRIYDMGNWISEHEKQDSIWQAQVSAKLDTILTTARRCGKE